MKKLFIASLLAALVMTGTTTLAQHEPSEYLGLPGDNLNLYAVMKLFQESETLEGFERNLNDENSKINNLDLNGDNLVDYITVHDYVDGQIHNIVLRVALDRNESQDVAVFTVDRYDDGSVRIQLVGDEALYGKDYIIEPYYAENGETPNPGYTGQPAVQQERVVRTTVYEVAAWPLIRFMYLPDYIAWRSGWYWGYWPAYWHAWHPWYWHCYYGYHYNWHPHYYAHFRHWNHYRFDNHRDHYYSRIRASSPQVSHRIQAGNYRETYSRPESRSEGEALFARSAAGQNREMRETRTDNNRERTPASISTGERRPDGTGVERGSARSGYTRPAATSTGRRSEVNSGQVQQTGDNESPAPAVNRTERTTTQKSATVRSSGNSESNSRRSTSVSDRSESKSQSSGSRSVSSHSRSSSSNVGSGNSSHGSSRSGNSGSGNRGSSSSRSSRR